MAHHACGFSPFISGSCRSGRRHGPCETTLAAAIHTANDDNSGDAALLLFRGVGGDKEMGRRPAQSQSISIGDLVFPTKNAIIHLRCLSSFNSLRAGSLASTKTKSLTRPSEQFVFGFSVGIPRSATFTRSMGREKLTATTRWFQSRFAISPLSVRSPYSPNRTGAHGDAVSQNLLLEMLFLVRIVGFVLCLIFRR